MNTEEIIGKIASDMKEGGLEYQPAYWQSKLRERINSAIANAYKLGEELGKLAGQSEKPKQGT